MDANCAKDESVWNSWDVGGGCDAWPRCKRVAIARVLDVDDMMLLEEEMEADNCSRTTALMVMARFMASELMAIRNQGTI